MADSDLPTDDRARAALRADFQRTWDAAPVPPLTLPVMAGLSRRRRRRWPIVVAVAGVAAVVVAAVAVPYAIRPVPEPTRAVPAQTPTSAVPVQTPTTAPEPGMPSFSELVRVFAPVDPHATFTATSDSRQLCETGDADVAIALRIGHDPNASFNAQVVPTTVFDAKGIDLTTGLVVWDTDLLQAVPETRQTDTDPYTFSAESTPPFCSAAPDGRTVIGVPSWPGTIIIEAATGHVLDKTAGFVATQTVGAYVIGTGGHDLQVRRIDALQTQAWSKPNESPLGDDGQIQPHEWSDFILADKWVRTTHGFVAIADGTPAPFGSDLSNSVWYTSSAGILFRWVGTDELGDDRSVQRWDPQKNRSAWPQAAKHVFLGGVSVRDNLVYVTSGDPDWTSSQPKLTVRSLADGAVAWQTPSADMGWPEAFGRMDVKGFVGDSAVVGLTNDGGDGIAYFAVDLTSHTAAPIPGNFGTDRMDPILGSGLVYVPDTNCPDCGDQNSTGASTLTITAYEPTASGIDMRWRLESAARTDWHYFGWTQMGGHLVYWDGTDVLVVIQPQ